MLCLHKHTARRNGNSNSIFPPHYIQFNYHFLSLFSLSSGLAWTNNKIVRTRIVAVLYINKRHQTRTWNENIYKKRWRRCLGFSQIQLEILRNAHTMNDSMRSNGGGWIFSAPHSIAQYRIILIFWVEIKLLFSVIISMMDKWGLVNNRSENLRLHTSSPRDDRDDESWLRKIISLQHFIVFLATTLIYSTRPFYLKNT